MKKYDPVKIEPYWQKVWGKTGTYQPDLKRAPKPFYNLMMFPYPSAEGLHVGNMFAFTGADIYGRFKRMQGFSVFEPIGLDGFGIHSENYALRVGKHPAELAKITEKKFYSQLRVTGNAYDWRQTLETYDPGYYRFTQWIFIQMFRHGLAYRAKASVNWCPSCLTVLADEQVISGACERCHTLVEKKELEQWFFKITQYVQRLLENLEKINWSEKVKIAQRNWIGKSEGVEIEFPLAAGPAAPAIKVFTTRPDTLFGATFMVVSPEQGLIEEILSSKFQVPSSKLKELKNYVEVAKGKTEQERIEEGKVKTGVFTGLYCQNPATGQEIPIWVADYVVMAYGTGAIMAVPAHDQRDFEFAKKYKLPIKTVVSPTGVTPIKGAYEGWGTLVNSGSWNGWEMPKELDRVIAWLEKKGIGKRKVTYKLRDWCISRQRYWGPPIPMINCPKCGWVPEKEENLPVLLPEVSDWRPKGTGKSPLATVESFVRTKCPNCGSPAERETDVSDTFLDSAWYFLRYPSINLTSEVSPPADLEGGPSTSEVEELPWDSKITKKWLPVDMYIGGAEHSVLHLMYSRFLTMAFKDWGLLDFEEPFEKFRAHGLLISQGAKMSKSRGNVVIPDAYITRYGADTLRCYLMFLGPFDQGGDFRDEGILGIWRFLNRVWNLTQNLELGTPNEKKNIRINSDKSLGLIRIQHQTIKKVTEDIENLRYNTALAALMEYLNEITNYELKDHLKTLILLLAPFAPHITEELWSRLDPRPYTLNPKYSIHLEPWPQYDPKMVKEEQMTVVVEVNGKVREKLKVKSEKLKAQKEIEVLALASPKVKKFLAGKRVCKVIFIPGKIINFVTK